jgi:aspartyl-tRNA(Asn)/glutamyl-tRNA(Gln) amidotransferase subunit C
MKKLTKKEIEYVSSLANLPLTRKEQEEFGQQLSEVIDYNVDLLRRSEVKGLEPTAHIGGIADVLEEDQPEPGLTNDEALRNAKSTHNGFFRVKAILEK